MPTNINTMYYEETWIGDSLFWRSSPNGKWIEFTIADYKTKVRQLEQQVKSVDLADVVLRSEQLVCCENCTHFNKQEKTCGEVCVNWSAHNKAN